MHKLTRNMQSVNGDFDSNKANLKAVLLYNTSKMGPWCNG